MKMYGCPRWVNYFPATHTAGSALAKADFAAVEAAFLAGATVIVIDSLTELAEQVKTEKEKRP